MKGKGSSFSKKNILLGVTGSIAAYKACDLVSRLKREGADVRVVMTENATRLVSPVTFQTLSKNPVYTDLWASTEVFNPLHIALSEFTELLIIAPATCNIIGKLANGIADDLLSTLAISLSVPALIAPAMDEKMWRNAVVQENVQKLKSIGYRFVGPVYGPLASGKEGLGRLAEVEAILSEASELARKTKGK